MRCLSVLLAVLLVSCNAAEDESQPGEDNVTRSEGREISDKDSLQGIDIESFVLKNDEGRDVNIVVERPVYKPIGSAILLHGWDLPPTEWCEETNLCTKLKEAGFIVIMPDHGKSTYQWENYPETIEKYRESPTRGWMYQHELKMLKEEGFLDEDNFNIVIGLSTGGRGAALFALENPESFDACVALSADFDQTKLGDEPINTGFYGPYEDFPERWEDRDNIERRAEELEVPILIGHGAEDEICKPFHSEQFFVRLNEVRPDLKKSLVIKEDHGHDYMFWSAMTEEIMAFIKSVQDAEQ